MHDTLTDVSDFGIFRSGGDFGATSDSWVMVSSEVMVIWETVSFTDSTDDWYGYPLRKIYLYSGNSTDTSMISSACADIIPSNQFGSSMTQVIDEAREF